MPNTEHESAKCESCERLRAAVADLLPIADMAPVGKLKKQKIENARRVLEQNT